MPKPKSTRSTTDKAALRRKIQQLLIDKLLSQTTRFWKKSAAAIICVAQPAKHGLALEVEDTKQKNVRRLPKNPVGR